MLPEPHRWNGSTWVLTEKISVPSWFSFSSACSSMASYFAFSRVYPQGESYMRSFPTMHIKTSTFQTWEKALFHFSSARNFHQGLLPKLDIPLPKKLAQTSHGAYHEELIPCQAGNRRFLARLSWTLAFACLQESRATPTARPSIPARWICLRHGEPCKWFANSEAFWNGTIRWFGSAVPWRDFLIPWHC